MEPHEQAEETIHHASQPFDKIVAGSTAIIAAILATVSVAGQHFTTEELLLQGKASDTWAYYQAKDIRRFTAEATRDLASELKPAAKSTETYEQLAHKYKADAEKIQEQARDYEKERDVDGKKENRFHFGEIFLEVGIVFSSMSILTKTKLLFFAGAVSAVAGLVIAIGAWAM